MKKELTSLRGFVLVLMAGILLASCSKKESESADIIVGKWNFSNATFNARVGARSLMEYLTDEFEFTSSEAQQYIVVLNAMLQQSFTGTIELKSNSTYTSNFGGAPDTGTWSLSQSGDKLTVISDSEGPAIYDVLELNSNTLVLKITELADIDLDGDGDDETVTITVEMTLKK